jgi:hypothetical protein
MAWVGKRRREMWGGDEADISLAGMQKFRLEWIWIRGRRAEWNVDVR